MSISDIRKSPSRNHGTENGAPALARGVLEAIRQFDTCTVANAIERFGVRLRNEGYTHPGLYCVTGGSPRVVGYAATARVRLSDPPMTGGAYIDRSDWWTDIQRLPAPRIAVVQDVDAKLRSGAVAGQVHAAILKAFRCDALITNGAVRDMEAVAGMAFPMFAHAVAVSHAYLHLVDYGEPVEVFGLHIRCGDLLLADTHGAISIPLEIAAEVPRKAAEMRSREQRIIDLCQSPGFSPEKLLEAVKDSQ
jgi:regulator of RNase E activity RraA